MTLKELSKTWEDTEVFHKNINDTFAEKVNGVEWLREHRKFVTANAFGFGENCFHWLWKLLVDEMPSEFSFLEIGIFRGQVLSLMKMLASSTGRSVTRYGVSPLSNADGHWYSDYAEDIKTIHNKFFIPQDYTIYQGLSTEPEIIEQAKKTAPYDILYIDGGHTLDVVTSDFKHYAPMVKRGGYLVVDDCNNEMNMPFGFFQGIAPVTQAKMEYMKQHPNDWEFVFSVVHISVFRKK